VEDATSQVCVLSVNSREFVSGLGFKGLVLDSPSPARAHSSAPLIATQRTQAESKRLFVGGEGFRATREHLDTFSGPAPERQGQNVAVTVLYFPHSIDCG